MKLNRNQLRSLILKEASSLNEQKDAFEAVIDLNEESIEKLMAAYKSDGIMGFFEETARQGAINFEQIWKLASNEQLQQEMQNTLDNEGVEAAYTLWVTKLQNKI